MASSWGDITIDDDAETKSPKVEGLLQDHLNFPSFKELPRSREGDERYFGQDPRDGRWKPCRTWCFLAEIQDDKMSQTTTSFQNAQVLVRDKDGQSNIRVFFPRTFGQFDLTTLKNGSTILVLYPESHTFMDGTSGVRIEKTDHVKVLECKLDDLLAMSLQYEKVKDKIVCWCCGKPGISADAVKKCSRCRVAKYCDKQCQTKDWKARHKAWCGTIPDFIKLSKFKFNVWRENQTFGRYYNI